MVAGLIADNTIEKSYFLSAFLKVPKYSGSRSDFPQKMDT